MGILHFGSGGGLAIALVLDIVALSTPGWWYTSTAAFGLFYFVAGTNSAAITQSTSTKVAISFLIIGGFFLLVGVILCMMSGTKKEEKKMGKLGGILGISAGIFITVGMATFTGMNSDFIGLGGASTASWGYSYALGWGAMGISLLAGAAGAAF